jgi:peroxiredoxin family protein
VAGEPLGVLLISGTHERAHYAFVLAAGAAALGRAVTVFATNQGCHALLADWSGLADSAHDAVIRARGVAGLDELRAAAAELGVRLLVCEAGLRASALLQAPLWPGVEIAGIASFLGAVGTGQIVSL